MRNLLGPHKEKQTSSRQFRHLGMIVLLLPEVQRDDLGRRRALTVLIHPNNPSTRNSGIYGIVNSPENKLPDKTKAFDVRNATKSSIPEMSYRGSNPSLPKRSG